MNLRDIEYFVVVAEHGNLGRAAEALGLGQPALSKCLRRLEKSAQAKLVRRTPKGVELTAAGEALLSHVHRLRLALDDVAHEVADVGQGRAGRLRIGTGAGLGEQILAPACGAFAVDAPKVSMHISVATRDVLLPILRRGELEMIIVGMFPVAGGDLVQEHIFNDDLVVYAAADHLLARRKRITLEDVAAEGWVVPSANMQSVDVVVWRDLVRQLEDRGLAHPRIAMESTSLLLRLQTVAGSRLVGFTSRTLLDQFQTQFNLVELPVQGLKWTRKVGVCYRKDAYLSPAAVRFIRILKQTAKTAVR